MVITLCPMVSAQVASEAATIASLWAQVGHFLSSEYFGHMSFGLVPFEPILKTHLC